MTVIETSRRIGISPSKLYQLVAARKIGHHRIGGKIIFQEEDVVAFLAACRVGTTSVQTTAPRPRLKLKHISLSYDS